MAWLFSQVFLLCLLSFLVGALACGLLVALPLWRRTRRTGTGLTLVSGPLELPVARSPDPSESLVATVELPAVEPDLAEPAPVVPGPFPGSALPRPDGAAPSAEYQVKGNLRSRIYHAAGSPHYARTRAGVWFRSGADAERAGFAPWNAKRRVSA